MSKVGKIFRFDSSIRGYVYFQHRGTGTPAVLLDFVLRGPMQKLERAPSFAVSAKGGLLRSNAAQSPLPALLFSFLTSHLSTLNYELFSPTSKMPINSARNSSNSRNFSSVAATSFFFHTNT